MKYKDKVKTGTIEEQLKRLFQTTNYYYQKEFEKLKTTFASLRESDIQLMQLNNELLALSQNLIPEYNLTANKLKAQSHDELKQQLQQIENIKNKEMEEKIIKQKEIEKEKYLLNQLLMQECHLLLTKNVLLVKKKKKL